MAEERTNCTVRDGRFVEPCQTLLDQTDNMTAAIGRAKGTVRWHYMDMRTRKPSRTFFGIKTQSNPNGFAFNFCPFCGEKIDAPFADDEPTEGAA